MKIEIGAWTSLVMCFFYGMSFVGSLYVWRHSAHLDRDHPLQIKRRLVSIGVISVCLPFSFYLFNTSNEGPGLLSWIGMGAGGRITILILLTQLILPLLLTISLFLGPLVLFVLTSIPQPTINNNNNSNPHNQHNGDNINTNNHGTTTTNNTTNYWVSYGKNTVMGIWEMVTDSFSPPHYWISIRNYVVAPFAEELVFRALMCPLLISGGWSMTAAGLLSPFIFGIAHLHHLVNLMKHRGRTMLQGTLIVGFQLCYTTIFAIYANFLFCRTGSLWSVVLCHSFCNVMGFPDFSWASDRDHPQYTHRYALWSCFVAGVIAFSYLLFPLTNPTLYGAPHPWEIYSQ